MPNNRKEYLKEYYQRNKEKIKEQKKEYYQSKKEERDSKTNENRKLKPWLRYLINARQRCHNPNCPSYKFYGLKGIRCLLTLEEVKTLYLRDKASEMHKPSLDRKDSTLDYTFTNCRFVELVINVGKKVDSY
jgi:hypothetical protein